MTNVWKFALAVLVAVVLNPLTAHAHPMGSMVSKGSNPIVNVGGSRTEGPGIETVFTAPSDQDVVVTDIIFSTEAGALVRPTLKLDTSGTIVGQYFVFGANYASGGLIHLSLQTGIRIPAGESLQLEHDSWSHLHYAFSGYYTQP